MSDDGWDGYEPSWSTNPVPGVECEKDCCCNCRFHRPAHLHCCHVASRVKQEHFAATGRRCICDQRVGWVCAFPDKDAPVFINWSEHGMCEMHTRREEDA